MAINTGNHTKPYTLQHILNQSFDPETQTLVFQALENASTGIKRSPSALMTFAFENDSNGNPVYIGKAPIGTAKSASSWQIRKLTYSGDAVTDIQWANGSDAFTNIWDDRASLSYS